MQIISVGGVLRVFDRGCLLTTQEQEERGISTKPYAGDAEREKMLALPRGQNQPKLKS